MKRVVIKEELVALTGDWLSAAILDKLLCLSERTREIDDYLEKERRKAESGGWHDIVDALDQIPPRQGWTYKTLSELVEELVQCAAGNSIRLRIKELVDKGFLQERNNPHDALDRTLQYQPNVTFIQQELAKLGYVLEGYRR